MLKGNLSTRPFYNDRLVVIALGLVAVLAIGMTAFNANEVTSLSKERSALLEAIRANTDATSAIEAKVAGVRGAIDLPRLRMLAVAVEEANDLIDQRTFSWTAFFGVIEKTLPFGVRLVAVTQKVEKGVMVVGMNVVCQRPEDLQDFVLALDKSPEFRDVNPAARQNNDDGTETAVIEAVYLPASKPTPAPPTAAKAPGRGRQ
jgi:hypothetical protein